MPFALILATSFFVQDFDADKSWDLVSKRISQFYWAKDSQSEKLNRLLSEAAPSARSAKTVAEFNVAMDNMIAKFGDSHFDFLTKDDQGFYLFDGFAKGDKAAKMPNIGAWFKQTPDGYRVMMVLESGAASVAGLQKGDLIQTVDGRPFSPVESLRDKIGSTVNLIYVDSKGQTKKAATMVSESPGQELFLNATKKSSRVIEQGSKKIAYMHLWTMANDKFKGALEGFVYGSARETDAFILDLRDGFGGRPEGYGDPFFRPEANLEWTFGSSGTTKQLFGYGRPLIVIINPGSRSAKEVFSYIIKKSGRGILVGSKTAGDVLGTSPSPVGDWAYIEIPMVGLKVDGIQLEHNPVIADVQVASEFDQNGKDLYLEKAMEVAVERASKTR